ncbi:hypothetical protein LCGC14_0282720 [marine sediment metagenome]|uniref:Uncharacterized protein n=1 Tax=marine sediment metagenome TaxID=412755 RepID=A0A0F9X109_9ZZZZ
MRLQQLYEYLGGLLEVGVAPDIIVCLPESVGGLSEDAGMDLSEVDSVALVTGPYREDPSPKMPAPLSRSGKVLLLTSVNQDYGPLEHTHDFEDLTVEVPEKTWPNGWGK